MKVRQLQGHCYCGEVWYQVSVGQADSPMFTAYCHCENCRRAHAAPLYQVACIDAARFEITTGVEHVVPFSKTPRITRAFAGCCGTRLYNTFSDAFKPGGRTPLAFFPDTLVDEDRRSLPQPLVASDNFSADRCVLQWDVLDAMRGPEAEAGGA